MSPTWSRILPLTCFVQNAASLIKNQRLGRNTNMCSVGISTEPNPKVSMVTVAQQTEDQHSLGAMATQNQIQIH